MRRMLTMVLLGAIALGAGTAAEAKAPRKEKNKITLRIGGGKVPITNDLARLQRIDERLARNGFVMVAGRMRELPLSPDWYYRRRDPSGVVGFSGTPGAYGDGVNSFGALPPGSIANLDGQLY